MKNERWRSTISATYASDAGRNFANRGNLFIVQMDDVPRNDDQSEHDSRICVLPEKVSDIKIDSFTSTTKAIDYTFAVSSSNSDQQPLFGYEQGQQKTNKHRSKHLDYIPSMLTTGKRV